MKHTLVSHLRRVFIFFATMAILVSLAPQAETKDSTWGAIVIASQRYQALANFNNQAVLDKETGLIWEQCPSLTEILWDNPNDPADNATLACGNKVVGGRAGWRLPSYAELKSLGDPSKTPFLPNSSPFCNMNFDNTQQGPAPAFWSTTSTPSGLAIFAVSSHSVSGIFIASKNGGSEPVWCVRGPSQ